MLEVASVMLDLILFMVLFVLLFIFFYIFYFTIFEFLKSSFVYFNSLKKTKILL